MFLNTTESMTISFPFQKRITTEQVRMRGQPIGDDRKMVKPQGFTHMKHSNHVDELIAKSQSAFHEIVRLKRAGLDSYCLVRFYEAS